MKKARIGAALAALAPLMTSCRAHIGDLSYDIPWYYIAAFIIAVFILAHIYIVRQTFICPECKTEFRPKWYELSSWLHTGGERVVRCPACHRKGFCKKAD